MVSVAMYDNASAGCLKCQTEAARLAEREWMRLHSIQLKQIALSQFVWRFRSVVERRFIGLANAGHYLSVEFRRVQAKRMLGADLVKCTCEGHEELMKLSPLERMLRPDVRSDLRVRFGGSVSIQQLVSMPAGWVLWQNADLVGVAIDGLVYGLSEEGPRLDVCLASYVSANNSLGQVFESEQAEQYLRSTAYLQVVMPEYKRKAYLLCGDNPSVDTLFALSRDWFDWPAFSRLRIQHESLCYIGELNGEPLSDWMMRYFSTALVAARHNLAASSDKFYLSDNTLCVQPLLIQSATEVIGAEPVYVTPSEDLRLREGRFLFIIDKTPRLLMLPRSVFVRVHGVVYGAYDVEVAVVLEHDFVLDLYRTQRGNSAIVAYDADVHVKIRDLNSVGILEWYSCMIDRRSMDAQMITSAEASAVVLRWPAACEKTYDRRYHNVDFHVVNVVDPLDAGMTTVIHRLNFERCDEDDPVFVGETRGFSIFSQFRDEFSNGTIVNGCIRVVSTAAAIALRGLIWMSQDLDADKSSAVASVSREYVKDQKGSVQALIPDYIANAFDYGLCHGRPSVDRHGIVLTKRELADIPGYCYVKLLHDDHYAKMADVIGAYPPLHVLMYMNVEYAESGDIFSKFRIVRNAGIVHVTELKSRVRGTNWGLVDFCGTEMPFGTLGYMLAHSFPDGDVVEGGSDDKIYLNDTVGADLADFFKIGLAVSLTMNIMFIVLVIYLACFKDRKRRK